MKCYVPLIAVAFTAISISVASAQTGSTYTNRQLSALQTQNSASLYTTKQVQNQIYNRTVPTFAYSNVNRGLFDSALGRAKPFSGLAPRPSVSPYLALSSPFSSTASNYYTQVRPALEQQRVNQQLEQRNAAMQRQLSAIAAQGPYSTQGNEDQAPTGHAAVYMNYGGYYQMPAPKR